MTGYFGGGTRSSPITLDDSEGEVYYELYKGSNHSSSSSLSVNLEMPPLPKPKPWGWSIESQPPTWERKRKRTHSFISHDGPMAGPSAPQRGYTTLENRLSQPESKKARKRRRKAERQVLEDTRTQHLNWLNAPSPFASGVPILPLRSWSNDVQMYGGYPPPRSTDRASYLKLGVNTGFTPPSSSAILPEPDDFTLYDNREPHSVSPPPPPSRWVSSMAKAASDPIDLTIEEHDQVSQWSPLSTQVPLPSPIPPPLPPHAPNAPYNPSRLNISSLPKPVEHHALPPKPPPPQPMQTTIGMKPDQDPKSKHGIFQLASATKEAGKDIKKKGPFYMPNPARTLVMEHLPKTHRHPDFINNWSKSACGTHPVHMFIDGPGGKALIEFATAELARKAWASPKLGQAYAYQAKGKSREDLIKVWWYRVDGVGAGSGVGEIEEGEIEGDVIEREADQPFRKETKKEKKARLAKEREEKKVKRELELRLIKERHASLQQLQVELPTSSTSSFAVPENLSQRALTPVLPRSWPPTPILLSPSWSPEQAPTQHLPIASGADSWVEWGRPSPSDNWVESWGPSSTYTVAGQVDDLDNYESNMEIDEPRPPPLPYTAVQHVVQTLPLHSSLPLRPTSSISAPLPRVVIPSPRPVYKAPQVALPLPLSPPIILPSVSSSSSSTPSPSLPSEPRAMKNAPTEPSFTKRALMARQKELEERIAKSKLELAETRSSSTSKPETPVISMQLADNSSIPVKPSMDLGEKQAMEDRLRKLVLQSQRARGKAGAAASSDNNNGASNVSATTMMAPGDAPSISVSSSLSSSSSSAVPSPVVPSNQLAQLPTVSLSTHNFSLEDLAVSFITQTIETIKSQPTPTIHPSNKPASITTQSNSNDTKLELAAKQRRLEQHIMESKSLMTKLAQARTKEEKDTILKAMREMTRSFEEGSQSKMTPPTTTMKAKTNVTPSPVILSKNPSPGPFVRIWPGGHEGAGVLILSDSDSDNSSESDGE